MAAAEPAQVASFAPIAGPRTRLLILGSLPGAMSLRRGQYYGNPRNQFWRLVGVALEVDMPEEYEERLATLAATGVGLWDVVRTATRSGSLDADIRDHAPNPLAEYVATLPQLRAVAFNGATASAIGRRRLGERAGLALVTLPSSSPAHTLPFERKAEAWRRLRAFIA